MTFRQYEALLKRIVEATVGGFDKYSAQRLLRSAPHLAEQIQPFVVQAHCTGLGWMDHSYYDDRAEAIAAAEALLQDENSWMKGARQVRVVCTRTLDSVHQEEQR